MDIHSNLFALPSEQRLGQAKTIESKATEVQVKEAEHQSFGDWHSFSELMRDSQQGMMSNTLEMRELYSGVQNDLLNDAPNLMGKDWDFSVDEKGGLVIIEGEDKLSESEINQLTKALKDNDIDKAMNKLADSIINWGEGARGPDGTSNGVSENMAKYDVNKENFKDIIFGRELMLNVKVSDSKSLTEDQTNHYASNKISLESSSRELQLRAVEAYNENRQPPLALIESQLAMRAKDTL